MEELDIANIGEITLSLLKYIGNNMPGGFFVYKADESDRILYINDVMLDIFGCETESEFKELTGNTFSGMVYSEDVEYVNASILKQIAKHSRKLDYVEYRIRRKDNEIRWVDDYGRLVHTKDFGDVFYVLIRDITEHHRLRCILTETDHLTGVYNRRFFAKELDHQIGYISDTKKHLSMIMIDIDFFKKYNDSYGHLAGDRCLATIASTMNKTLKSVALSTQDKLFRYGGEEFAILLPEFDKIRASKIAEQIRQAVFNVNIPYTFSEYKRVTISLGVAELDAEMALHVKNPSDYIIQITDIALYAAKKSGRNTVRMYTSSNDGYTENGNVQKPNE
ncbi:MAG: sensor domain-containing diguanylate cyclase [Desulfovibrionaceae bacterium]|nr:sensor domain-containing diguanylate cyclase [Desulfovibrionaceae bacterium]